MKIKKIGIVGCGVMGSGIALLCAQYGQQVIIRDIKEEIIQKAMAFINDSLTKNVDKGRLSTEEKDNICSRITGTVNLVELRDCDFIIEAVPEELELKKQIFAELDKICSKHIVLASNTSAQSITDIAMATGRPDKVIGMHFFNPVSTMKLVELVVTIMTSDETLESAQEYCRFLGKETIVTRDGPGFIVNRLSTPFLLDAVRMLENGLATREDIDKAVKLGLNHPMGPLALIDLIGVELVYNGACFMYNETKDPKFAPPVLLKKMVTAGWLGRKTGKGFYDYNSHASEQAHHPAT